MYSAGDRQSRSSDDRHASPIRAHVIAMNSPEVEELRRFRETLKADAGLLQEYVMEKQRILAGIGTDSLASRRQQSRTCGQSARNYEKG
jgi:hypothetical protein